MDILTNNPELLTQNIFGAVAFVLTCVALMFLRKQNSKGWLVFLPSYLIQMIIFWHTEQVFLLFQMIVLLIFSLINYFKWEDEKNESFKDYRSG
jgi:hypothetical protein